MVFAEPKEKIDFTDTAAQARVSVVPGAFVQNREIPREPSPLHLEAGAVDRVNVLGDVMELDGYFVALAQKHEGKPLFLQELEEGQKGLVHVTVRALADYRLLSSVKIKG
ncbi:MAG: hypothetical protein NWF13_08750 [Candidatus Bathyarchaeota archaeon]|nr:hypothetical protein [Candidatus Bathyarchaeota archaeon]